jgi:anion-transporting  ArsA/GET3 family ATPase
MSGERKLSELVTSARVIVCGGPGGVGKTTTAATLALVAARRGRRAVVVTIDPAKRLADALGIAGGLTNEPTRIELPSALRRSGGELWAMMLDTRATFDGVVRRYATDDGQAERILANPFYKNIAGALSGTQEYMAAEKLYELQHDDRFDLVVIDTPPARNALDFLDAPARLVRFLDHPLYHALMLPTRAGLRVLSFATQAMTRTIARVVGGEVINDVVSFFHAFSGMDAGFRARAEAVTALLQSPLTTYVVITSPRREAVAEAEYFTERLTAHGVAVSAVVINRRHPHFTTQDAGAVAARAAAAPADEALANLAELTAVAEGEDRSIRPLLERTGAVPVVSVPLLVHDVHDIEGLAEIASHLFASGARR